ncbi:MAG: phenylacetic acid degradation protein [Thermoprotei archaeon]|nr:MAG: phenylacetic acid degradation protein [Thermoprotei archaeon]
MKEGEKEEIRRKVIEALRKTYDPEIPVNVYDLGLIYDIRIKDDKTVEIDMTMTAPGCPVAGMVVAITEATVQEELGEEYKVKVNLVWDPPWTPKRVTPEGRKVLKEIFGYDIVAEWEKRMEQGE